MSELTEKGKIVLEELKKDKGKTPKNTLAKLILAKYPGIFTSVENARDAIRYYSGNSGNRDRKFKKVEHKTHTNEQINDRFYFPSDAADLEDYILKPGKWGIVNDIHYPYHDTKALEIA